MTATEAAMISRTNPLSRPFHTGALVAVACIVTASAGSATSPGPVVASGEDWVVVAGAGGGVRESADGPSRWTAPAGEAVVGATPAGERIAVLTSDDRERGVLRVVDAEGVVGLEADLPGRPLGDAFLVADERAIAVALARRRGAELRVFGVDHPSRGSVLRLPEIPRALALVSDADRLLAATADRVRTFAWPSARTDEVLVFDEPVGDVAATGRTSFAVALGARVCLVDLRDAPERGRARPRCCVTLPETVDAFRDVDEGTFLAMLGSGRAIEIEREGLSVRGTSAVRTGRCRVAPPELTLDEPPAPRVEPAPPADVEAARPSPPADVEEPPLAERTEPRPPPPPPSPPARDEPPAPPAEERAPPLPETADPGVLRVDLEGRAELVDEVVLMGPDDMWTERARVEPRSYEDRRRAAVFRELPPGRYVVVVMGRDGSSVAARPSPARVDVPDGEGARVEVRVIGRL